MSKVAFISDGYPIHGSRNRNDDAMRTAIEIGRKIRDGEIVGFQGAVQYADGSVSIVGAGHRKVFPIVGALTVAAQTIRGE